MLGSQTIEVACPSVWGYDYHVVNWYQARTALKAMMDRLVAPTAAIPIRAPSMARPPKRLKSSNSEGWPYPKHLKGRHFGIVAYGDSVGAETLRRSLADWLTDLELISAGGMGEADGYIGYMKPYATSHQEYDEDKAFQEDVLNVARALGAAVSLRVRAIWEIPPRASKIPNRNRCHAGLNSPSRRTAPRLNLTIQGSSRRRCRPSWRRAYRAVLPNRSCYPPPSDVQSLN